MRRINLFRAPIKSYLDDEKSYTCMCSIRKHIRLLTSETDFCGALDHFDFIFHKTLVHSLVFFVHALNVELIFHRKFDSAVSPESVAVFQPVDVRLKMTQNYIKLQSPKKKQMEFSEIDSFA